MLLTNRRHRFLFMALAGLEISWYAPALALLLVYLTPQSPNTTFDRLTVFTGQPLITIAGIWAAMLFYMLIADWLNRRQIDAPLRQIAILVSLLLTTALAVLLLLHPADTWLTLAWLPALLAAPFDFSAGVRPELVLLLLNFLLWFRVGAFTDRAISFFSVGISFRVAILLALVANGLLTTLGGAPAWIAIQYFSVTVVCGLIAVALARIDDKAEGSAHSSGAILPWPRLLQILLVTAVAVVLSLGIAHWFTPEMLRTVLGWTMPLWRVLGAILGQALMGILILITPLFEWLAEIIQARLSEIEPLPPAGPMVDDTDPLALDEEVDRAYLFRYCLVTGAIAVAIGLLWLFFVRTRRRPPVEENEAASTETVTDEGGTFGVGLDRLRAWLQLLRRYGLSAQLLAAVSVENIYANVLRLAARRGVKRPAAVPPDRFLPALNQLFPLHAQALERITFAYMRVHYGNREIAAEELEQLKQDYQAVKRTAEGDNPNKGETG